MNIAKKASLSEVSVASHSGNTTNTMKKGSKLPRSTIVTKTTTRMLVVFIGVFVLRNKNTIRARVVRRRRIQGRQISRTVCSWE